MEARETLWKRCLSTSIKPPPKKQQHLPLRDNVPAQRNEEEVQENISSRHNSVTAAVSNGQTMHIASHRSRKQATFLSIVPVYCITPFRSKALVSPPNLLYPPCFDLTGKCDWKRDRKCSNCACVDVLPRCWGEENQDYLLDYLFQSIVIIMAQSIPSVPIPLRAFFKCWDLPWLSTSEQELKKWSRFRL